MTSSPRRRRTARASRRITARWSSVCSTPALGLGDDLLGDDDHVPLLQPPGPLDRVAEERGEVVAGPHLRNPLEGDDLDHSGSPVTLTPAFVL